jgi:two-component system CheB/CheR fusion protein
MVVFTDVTAPRRNAIAKRRGRAPQGAAASAHIEHQLQHIRDELRTTREEMQTSEEELKSLNEALQSINQALQSIDEKLLDSHEIAIRFLDDSLNGPHRALSHDRQPD